jgi:hypothetical protein
MTWLSPSMKMEHERAGFDVVRFAKEQRYRSVVVILTACPDLAKDWKEQGAERLFVKPTHWDSWSALKGY